MNRIMPCDIKPDSIENIVCRVMESKNKVPMDQDTSEIMIGFMLDPESKRRAEEVLSKVWTAKAIVLRMKAQFNRDLDPRAAIIIASWAQSIGSCVMYMYYCQYRAKKKNIQGEFTMDHLVDAFPYGFITDTDMHEIWDSQKVDNRRENFEGLNIDGGSDNLVDYVHAAQSMETVLTQEAQA